jgi:glycine dehydrogenase
MGYSDTHTPGVILRNIMENPGWYTQYTPYQAEIAQGRLEALLNYQTMVMDLTGMEIANASLLDEATAAGEALHLAHVEAKGEANVFFVSELCHPQTVDVVKTRAWPLGIEVVVGDHDTFELDESVFGVLLQYPATDGRVLDYSTFTEKAHDVGATVVVAADLLSLALLTPPGEWGADVVVGNSQRFGVPMGFGGPHAAFMAARESFKRKLPGRIIGVSVDADGNPALRMALQTREQHIRREKATSNICTAQVLLAIMAGAYAVYHGPEGLRRIAERVRDLTGVLARGLRDLGHEVLTEVHFDTIRVRPDGEATAILSAALAEAINLRDFGDGTIGIALDEVTLPDDVDDLYRIFNGGSAPDFTARGLAAESGAEPLPSSSARASGYLEHEVFHRHHSETDMLRYLHKLESRDLSLNTSMIPLGSCTMKLNATAQMAGVTWPEFGKLHPSAPVEQAEGYRQIFADLESWLAEITGFSLRRAGRVQRASRHSGLPRGSRRRSPQHLPDPFIGARHQSRERGHGRYEGGRRGECRRRHHRPRRPSREGDRARGSPRRLHGHVSLDARCLRRGDRRGLSHRPRQRRHGVSGRCEPQRTGRALTPR